MSELDVDAHIKEYWYKIEEGSVIDENFKKWEYEKYGGSRTEFYSPDYHHPMGLVLYLSFMDVTQLEETMKQYYKWLGSVKYLDSMERTIPFMKLKQITPDGMANYLITHPADTELLGYQRKPDGTFKTSNGETIRYNLKNRFGPDGVKRIDNAILKAMEKETEKLGVDLGAYCGSDAFPLKAVNSDTDAEYNGHYEAQEFKVTMNESNDLETGIVPLVGAIIGINEDEEKELIPQL